MSKSVFKYFIKKGEVVSSGVLQMKNQWLRVSGNV